MAQRLPPEATRLRALSHPVRIAILQHLASAGPATATECAPFVGASPSACSWHLRALAKAGWIEPSESGNGKERPWRYVGANTNILASEVRGPIFLAVEASLMAESRRIQDQFLRQRDSLPTELADMSAFFFGLGWVSKEELTRLHQAIVDLFAPYGHPRADSRSGDVIRVAATWSIVPWVADSQQQSES